MSEIRVRAIQGIEVGDTITCTFTILEIEENGKAKAAAVYYNQAGNTVLEADLYGLLPGSTEQQILNTMRTEGRQ